MHMDWFHCNKFNLRPPASRLKDALEFQVTDIRVSDESFEHLEVYNSNDLTSDHMDYLPTDRGKACTVFMYGVSGDGDQVLARVSGFCPKLTYISPLNRRQALFRHLSSGLSMTEPELRRHCSFVRRKKLNGWHPSADDPNKPEEFDCCIIEFSTVSAYRRACKLEDPPGVECCEKNVDPIMQFVDETSVVPSGWCVVRTPVVTTERVSHCQIEITCAVDHVGASPKIDSAPLIVASVDIECYSSTGGFPDPDVRGDRVVVIGTTLWKMGTPLSEAVDVIQCVGPCDPVEGVTVISYDSEQKLLDGWRDLVTVEVQVDVLIGYNTFGFDYQYMFKRAERCMCTRFMHSTKIVHKKTNLYQRTLSSLALGDNDLSIIDMDGRCHIDVFQYIKSQFKLTAYSLNFVSETYLGEKKVDLPYKEMFAKASSGNAADMAVVAGYCAQDCRLPLRLALRLEIFSSMIEMSRVTKTSLSQLVTRGQQIKVFNQIVWTAHRQGYVMNGTEFVTAEEGYEGATVIDPTVGFYKDPTAVLDFASLYPSIILAHNLCMSTLVTDASKMGIEGVRYETHRASDTKEYTFVTSTEGVVPLIIRELLWARKKARKEMEGERDPDRKTLLNARQLALKVSANSVYGFMGAIKRGMYSCLAIADSVTSCGRVMINKTCDLVKQFTPCDVIYGDTDSVMLQMHDKSLTIEETFDIGERMADWVSTHFHEDVTLEMEKVYCPWLLLGKKRYAGLMYTPSKDGTIRLEKMDAKGVELVRRDNCKYAKTVYERVLKALLYDKDPELCRKLLVEELDRIVNNVVPIEDFVVTKSMKKKESYANELQPHLIVADKMRKRQPGSEPQNGDRVPYVIVEGPEERINERAEDPVFAKENGVKPDRFYIVERQLVNSISTLLHHVLPNVDVIFKKYMGELEMQMKNQKSLLQDNHGLMEVTVRSRAVSPSKKGRKRKVEDSKQQQLLIA